MKKIDFIHEEMEDTDIILFGLDNPQKFNSNSWADIAVAAGVFSSKSQARKNGWGDNLKSGFQQKHLKNKNILISVLNIF